MYVSLKQFEKDILKELNNKNVAIFAGAGLSKSSGFVDWKGLLKEIADDIGLDIDRESDLISITQYYCNDNGRQRINEIIIEEFQKEVEENENLNILARLPIDTYWTTNYDSLIEDTLEKINKNADVKIQQNQLKYYKPNRDVIVYKMHGDKSDPDHLVITRDDYESYNKTRSLFTIRLKGELLSKTFIFIGFSFEDPNLEQVLSKIRVDLLESSPKNHYCFFKKVDMNDYLDEKGNCDLSKYEYDKIKQELKIKDLKRYGINTVLVDNYSDITKILKHIEKKYRINKIFISGSAVEYGYFSEKSAIELMYGLSKRLVHEGYHIISGFGAGVGSYIINGALEEIYSSNYNHIEDYLTLRPFPQATRDEKVLKELWTKYREDMVYDSGIVIFVFGNKLKDGSIVDADGVIEEFKIAQKQDKFIIPIGSTDYSSRKIFDEIKFDLDKYWYLKESISVLENERDPEKLTEEVCEVINRIRRKL